MWNRGGKDIDLTSPRAKDWKYKTVEAGKTPRMVEIKATVSVPPPARATPINPRQATVADAAQVLGRLNAYGVASVVGAIAVFLFLIFVFGDMVGDGEGVFGFLAIIGVVLLRNVAIATVAGLISLLRGERRAIWVEDDRLKVIDWWSGWTSLPLDQVIGASFEPRYRRNKSTEPAIVLARADRKPVVIGVRHIDVSGPELVTRIQALIARPPSQRA